MYCPRLQQGAGFAAITSGVIFPFADDMQVKNLFSQSLDHRGMSKWPQYSPVTGRNALFDGDIFSVFPESRRSSSQYMSSALAADIRHWLIEPDFSTTQRQPIELDANQRLFVTSRTDSGYRRIKGAAGSGKSLVLAARAAELLGQGKKVLVVTFNITLLHYLMDIAVRWPKTQGNTRSDITWLNFHAWCKRICIENDCEEEYLSLWGDENNPQLVLEYKLPSLVGSIIDEDTEGTIGDYDAVLVDEGQDFLPNWWAVLRKVCKPGGEMLLVADATQDIYDTAGSWTDEAMRGAGFRGGWAELPVSYRLPRVALEKASEFAKLFLPKESTTLPSNDQLAMDLEPCELRWVHVDEEDAPQVCCDEILRLFSESSLTNMAITDSTFLCGSRQFGLEVVNALGLKGIKTVHTYDLIDKESRRQKVGFYMGDARVKATTLHSFKGWESRILVIHVGGSINAKSLALIYTGLTRLKRNLNGSCLTVVSSAPELLEFGRSWSSFEKVDSPDIVF